MARPAFRDYGGRGVGASLLHGELHKFGGLQFFNSSLLIWVVFEFSQLVILLHNVLTVRGLDSKCFLVECRWGVLIYSSAHGV